MTGVGREEHPTACSIQVGLEFGARMQAAEIRTRIGVFLSDLTSFLEDNGCRLIGHIKGLLDAGAGGQLFFSVTSFEDNPRYKGEIDGEISEAMLSINVIIYGVGEESVERAIHERLGKQFAGQREK